MTGHRYLSVRGDIPPSGVPLWRSTSSAAIQSAPPYPVLYATSADVNYGLRA